MKPYKALPPLQTINNIHNILAQLGIFTVEYHIGLDGQYYSCRVVIGNNNLQKINIGTNGKGLSPEYALASAYAELMERIENRMIFKSMFYACEQYFEQNGIKPEFRDFLEKEGLLLDFRYYPDEKGYVIDNIEELLEQIEQYMPEAYDRDEADAIKNSRPLSDRISLLEVPFYNVNKKEIEDLPFQLIRLSAGSTGLCAGNTPEEAILQGINEIFERYVLQRIYVQKCVLPTIPTEYFKNTQVISLLERLKKTQGITYEIKDCSMGEGLPVIGLLMKDSKKNRYTFRLGADANPVIALQRCYTEAFQGVQGVKNNFRPINIEDESINHKAEFNQSVIDGMGRFPHSIFMEGKEESHFEGFAVKPRDDFKQELCEYVDYIRERDYTLYVRDNSFLGFPAYHLYIPGMSDTTNELYGLADIMDAMERHDFRGQISPEHRLKSLDSEELKELAKILETRKERDITLFPYYIGVQSTINRNLLLTLIHFKTGDTGKAYIKMSEYLERRESDNNRLEPYYYALRDYFYLMNRYVGNEEQTLSILKSIYGDSIAREVMNDMREKNNVFKNFLFPECFNCCSCKVRESCKYLDMLTIDSQIQNYYKQNLPQQELSHIFMR